MSSDIQRAVREETKILLSISGLTGSGKTCSSLKVARGMVGPDGLIGFLDTDNKRSRHFADRNQFDVIDMTAPYSPLRHIEQISKFEAAGYKLAIIDTMSHEWMGPGGICDMAEKNEARMGRAGLAPWKRPKSDHAKLMYHILSSPMSFIFCCRVKNKSIQRKKPDGKSEIVRTGLLPVQEGDFMSEMTVSILLDEKTNLPTLTKCPEDLVDAIPLDERLSIATGEALMKWAAKGVPVDTEFEELARAGREVANGGASKLEKWFLALPNKRRAKIKTLLEDELKSIAECADRENEAQPEASEQDSPQHKRDPFTPTEQTPKDAVL